MTSLPENWVICTLDELLVSLESGLRPKGGVRGIESGIPSLGGEHLNYNGGFNFSSIKYVPTEFARKMTKGHIKKNDILIVKDGATTGKTAFVDQSFPYKDAVVNEHVFICRPTKQINSRYLFRFLMSQEGQKEILNNFQGSAQGGINRSFASNTNIPLAPIEEQNRILKKLERVLSKVQSCQERLDKIPAILKRFRQVVLAAACSGRLTEDWREKKGSLFQKEWDVVFLKDIAELRLGKMLDKSKNKGRPVKYLRNVNVRWMGFDLSNINTILAQDDEIKKLSIYNGDVLVCEGGEPGRAAVWEMGENDFIFQKALHRVRLKKDILPDWFVYNLKNDADNGSLSNLYTGTTIKHLTGESLAKYKFFNPPFEEQIEIVRRVKAIFLLVDKIEAHYIKTQTYINKLTQSILAKAFRGELVPQNPNDEPASVLFKKLQKEKKNKKD